jgi:hypothetical protein
MNSKLIKYPKYINNHNRMFNGYQNTFELSSSDMGFDRCLNSYPQNDSIEYSRRPSYFTDLLTNPSESSFSDQEQRTPSPFNGYEDYYAHHPLDKRRHNSLIEFTDIRFQQQQHPTTAVNAAAVAAAAEFSYTTAPWLPANNNSNTNNNSSNNSAMNSRSVSPMVYANPSIDMYSPQTYFSNGVGPHQDSLHNLHQSLSSCGPILEMNPLSDAMYRERASSASSLSSSSSSSSDDDSCNKKHISMCRESKTITKPVKQTRSRGRRVSNVPSTTGQKVFKCHHDDCGKIFKRSEHLKRHVRSIHTMEKRKLF